MGSLNWASNAWFTRTTSTWNNFCLVDHMKSTKLEFAPLVHQYSNFHASSVKDDAHDSFNSKRLEEKIWASNSPTQDRLSSVERTTTSWTSEAIMLCNLSILIERNRKWILRTQNQQFTFPKQSKVKAREHVTLLFQKPNQIGCIFQIFIKVMFCTA